MAAFFVVPTCFLLLLKPKTMLDKAKVLLAVNQLSSQFTLDELLDRLIFLNKVEEGLEDVKAGRVLNQEEAKERLAKWLK